jgi:transposase InsO family protein
LGDTDYVYCITILDNYSRAIVASALTRHQDLKSYLVVLYAAIKLHGIPETLVIDSGSIFIAKQARQIYEALGIEKKQITKRKPWENYSETTFSIQHRMADYHFEKASTWEALLGVHEKWVADYNYQNHWAHRDRTDDRHSPVRVLGWVKGKSHEDLDLETIFNSLRQSRQFNKLGYVRFRHWQIYGELGLAKQQAAIWLYQETLTIEFKAQPLSEYNFEYEDDQHRLKTVRPIRYYETFYKSPQLNLWPQGEVEWRMVRQLPAYVPRQTVTPPIATQLAFAV